MTYAVRFVHGTSRKSSDNYKTFFDRLEVNDVIFNLMMNIVIRVYSTTYVGTLVGQCNRKIIYRHFVELVMTQYGCISTIQRVPSVISEMNVVQIDRLEVHIGLHFQILQGILFQSSGSNQGYKVFNSKVVAPIKGDQPKPANVEVMIEEEHVMDTLDTLKLFRRVRKI